MVKDYFDVYYNPYRYSPYRYFLKWARDNTDLVNSDHCTFEFLSTNGNKYLISYTKITSGEKDGIQIMVVSRMYIDKSVLTDAIGFVSDINKLNLYVKNAAGIGMACFADGKSSIGIKCNCMTSKNNYIDVTLGILNLCVLIEYAIRSFEKAMMQLY